ncbi:MAG: zf-TFIIB domain-containing protein [Firmicutes bacterium]|nr:zf-TFIIB domain-containing protein [Bacillota bacterium]
MICPRDGSELVPEVFGDVDIDACEKCDGIWVDRGELARIIGMEKDLPMSEPAAVQDLTDRSLMSKLVCPRCTNVEMDPVYFEHSHKTLLDTCPVCSGIWLDARELKEIVRSVYQTM